MKTLLLDTVDWGHNKQIAGCISVCDWHVIFHEAYDWKPFHSELYISSVPMPLLNWRICQYLLSSVQTIDALQCFSQTGSRHQGANAAEKVHQHVKASKSTHNIQSVCCNNLNSLDPKRLIKRQTCHWHIQPFDLLLNKDESGMNTAAVIPIQISNQYYQFLFLLHTGCSQTTCQMHRTLLVDVYSYAVENSMIWRIWVQLWLYCCCCPVKLFSRNGVITLWWNYRYAVSPRTTYVGAVVLSCIALHSPYCADVPLRNCSLTHSLHSGSVTMQDNKYKYNCTNLRRMFCHEMEVL